MLKRLSLLHYIFLPPLSKINCPWVHGFISGHSHTEDSLHSIPQEGLGTLELPHLRADQVRGEGAEVFTLHPRHHTSASLTKGCPGVESESEVSQSCPTLCDPVDCSSSVHGIFQARVLEWVAISFSRGIFPTQGSNPGFPHSRQTL